MVRVRVRVRVRVGVGVRVRFHDGGELGGGGGEGGDLHGGDCVELAGRSDSDEVEALAAEADLVRVRVRA